MAFEYNGVVYRDLEPQVRYDAEQIELLKQQKSNATNIENGTGENSLVQKSFEGKENKAYQRNSVAFGSNTQAGMTEAEFNEHFKYDRDGNIKDPIVDDSGFAYSQSNGYAFSVGEETKAKDRGSVALGIANEAWGAGASAMGDHTKALSNFSHSFGKETVAGVSKYDGECATAFGKGTQATGENSFAGGEGSKATNKHSFAFGLGANAEGFAGTSFGEYTHATGADSLAAGRQSTASGNQSVALGFNAEATSTFAVAIGNNAKATGWGQVAVGDYNDPSVNKALFMVGNGSSDTDTGRKNAFTVLWDGRAKVQSAPVDDDDVVRLIDLTGPGGGGSGRSVYRHYIKFSVFGTLSQWVIHSGTGANIEPPLNVYLKILSYDSSAYTSVEQVLNKIRGMQVICAVQAENQAGYSVSGYSTFKVIKGTNNVYDFTSFVGSETGDAYLISTSNALTFVSDTFTEI